MKKRSNRLLRLIFQIEEDCGLALTFRERIDRPKNSPQLVPSLGRVGRVRHARCRGLGQRQLERLSPKDSASLAPDDLPQPGPKRFGRAQRPEAPKGNQKRILYGILGTAAIGQHRQRGRVGAVLVLTDQRREGVNITCPSSLNESGR
jgi:hypothetical protein